MYATCPFRGFLKHDLRLHDFDAPERRTTIEPMDRGSLIHGVLERLVDETLASGRPWSGWTPEDHLRLAELAGEAFGDYERRGLVGRALLWELEKSHILLELDRFLDSDDRRCRAGARVPIAAEYRFGDEDVPPLEIVAAGRPVRFRGMVDRVDRGRDGSLTVVDYKTGSSGSYTVLESDPVGGGERLQLAIYGLAAEAGLGGGSPPGGERPEGAGRGGGDVRARNTVSCRRARAGSRSASSSGTRPAPGSARHSTPWSASSTTARFPPARASSTVIRTRTASGVSSTRSAVPTATAPGSGFAPTSVCGATWRSSSRTNGTTRSS